MRCRAVTAAFFIYSHPVLSSHSVPVSAWTTLSYGALPMPFTCMETFCPGFWSAYVRCIALHSYIPHPAIKVLLMLGNAVPVSEKAAAAGWCQCGTTRGFLSPVPASPVLSRKQLLINYICHYSCYYWIRRLQRITGNVCSNHPRVC